MGYFNSNPWTDAANYGRGLGDTLGQILLQQPRLKYELARQQQQDVMQQAGAQREAQAFPLEQQYKQSQIEAEKARAGASEASKGYWMGKQQNENAALQSSQQLDPALMAVIPKLLGGQKLEPEEMAGVMPTLTGTKEGRLVLNHLLEESLKPAAERVTKPGDVVLQGGQPVYTNNMVAAKAPPQLSGGDLMQIISSGQTNSPEFQAAQGQLKQRLGMGGGGAPQLGDGGSGSEQPMPNQQPKGGMVFQDEDSARAAGAKAGDVIYIKGVGKVQLQ